MPNGFAGIAAKAFLTTVHVAQRRTQEVIKENDDQNAGIAARTPSTRVQRDAAHARVELLPFNPADALTGRFVTGHRNSTNIVVSRAEFATIARTLQQIDEDLGRCIYETAKEIEDMCNTIFIMPSVSPKCKEIACAVRESMSTYRNASDDLAIECNKFANDMSDIGS